MDKTILIVDDEENIRLLYEEELTEEGYNVILAKDGEEALAKIKEGKPDLVTLDIKMPGMDGLELLSHIREEDKDLPVIMCTAYGDYKRDFTVWAADAYIIKSADLSDLKTEIRELLSNR